MCDTDTSTTRHLEVLLLQPLSLHFESTLSKKFNLLKPWLSPLPLNVFLSTHAQSIKAIVSSGPNCRPIENSLLQLLPNLGIVATATAGVDHVELEACRKKGVAVTNAGEVYSADAADFGVGLLIDVLRGISIRQRLKGDNHNHNLLGSQVCYSYLVALIGVEWTTLKIELN